MIRNGAQSAPRGGASSRETAPRASEEDRNPLSRMNEYVQDRPTTALMIGFGVGFGAGLILACAFQESSRYFQRDESYAERLGNRVMESLKDVVPSSWRS